MPGIVLFIIFIFVGSLTLIFIKESIPFLTEGYIKNPVYKAIISFLLMIVIVLWACMADSAFRQKKPSRTEEYEVKIINDIAVIDDSDRTNLTDIMKRNFNGGEIVIKKIYKSDFYYGILVNESIELEVKK